ncbi:MAG TPA: SufE family protein [Capsulimonadaceae bacterium]|jgi:cysteine desulfuration protein SufE
MARVPARESITAIEDDIVESFELFDEWKERYVYIIELGGKMPPYPEEFRTPDYIVKGCQSQVWLHAELDDGVLYFDADSDAAIVRGLLSLAVRVFSGHTPEEIIATPPTYVQRMGLSDALSTQRSNGLNEVFGKMRRYAVAFAAVEQSETASGVSKV